MLFPRVTFAKSPSRAPAPRTLTSPPLLLPVPAALSLSPVPRLRLSPSLLPAFLPPSPPLLLSASARSLGSGSSAGQGSEGGGACQPATVTVASRQPCRLARRSCSAPALLRHSRLCPSGGHAHPVSCDGAPLQPGRPNHVDPAQWPSSAKPSSTWRLTLRRWPRSSRILQRRSPPASSLLHALWQAQAPVVVAAAAAGAQVPCAPGGLAIRGLF